MQSRFARTLLHVISASLVLVLALTFSAADAQDDGSKSGFVRFLENSLSTPDRIISLDGVEDIFSWNPKIARITVADRDGAWLQLEQVEVVWTRSALLSKKLDIDVLRAAKVAVLRRPLPAASAERKGTSGPPLEIVVDTIALPQVALAAPVVGVEAELSASGSATLTQEALAAKIVVDRQDRAGSLSADLRFEPERNILSADLKLEEPAGGLASELLRLRGRPPLALTLSGQGPLDRWQATLEMHANGVRLVSGAMSISRAEGGYRVLAKLAAVLGSLVPEEYAALLAGQSGVDLEVQRYDNGSIAVRTATLRSDGLDLAASGVLSEDFAPQQGKLSLGIGRAGRAELPFAPFGLSVASLRANVELESGETSPWRMEAAVEGAEGTFGRIAGLAFNALGKASDLSRPDSRATDFSLQASGEGVALADAGLNDAIGPSVGLSGNGSWSAGQPVAIESLQLALDGASAGFAGTVTRNQLSGSFSAAVGDLARFALLMVRPLKGQADLKATGTVTTAGTFDLKLAGELTDLAVGVAVLDPLLKGATKFEGGVARRDTEIAFDALRIASEPAMVEVDGSYAEGALEMTLAATLSDLALVTSRASGAAQVEAKLTGLPDAPKVEAQASGDDIVLMGRPLVGAAARFSGVVAGPETSGEAELSGMLGDSEVRGSAKLSAGDNGARGLQNLVVSIGESRASGDVVLGADGLLSGEVKVVSPDLSKVAPLFLVKGSGMLRADVTLGAQDGAQSAAFSATATDVVYENITLESADMSGDVRDLFHAPEIQGDFSVRNLTAGGLRVVTATGTARRQGQSTAFGIDARLADGRANLAGTLAPLGKGIAIALDSFLYARPGIDLALVAPTTIAVEAGTARLQPITLGVGAGTIAVSGQAGAQIDLKATLTNVPAALANSFSPTLGAEGSVSGTVNAKGPAASPNATFTIALANASVAASRNAGLGPLAASTDGTFANRTVTLKSRVSGAGGLAVNLEGTAGTAQNAPLKMRITGSAPLSLGNPQLAARGAALEGALQLDIAVSGTASAPKFSGRLTSEGGGFVDPDTGIVLRNLQLAATFSGDRLLVDRLRATSGEGTISANGSVGLGAGTGFPVDLALKVARARYVDGSLVAARFDADLKLTGSLSAGPLLVGTVTLDRTEITVPESLPRGSVAVDVKHVDPPALVKGTLAIVRKPAEAGGRGGAGPSGIRLDLTVKAPQRIFVRGRGLDTEFGGELKLAGPVSAIAASGAFWMVRGRLDFLTQRIAFDRGAVTFSGDLDPVLDFSGSTRSDNITITVTVSGRASDPRVTFTSSPDLPQDEILARLIFQKGIGELSPLQVARLAAAASELSGGAGGVLSRLRATTGLDDLDIVTDDKGEAALAAGRYISDNVYLGVQQGIGSRSSRVTIDLDVTKNLKARAGMGMDGDSSLGIFFEREY